MGSIYEALYGQAADEQVEDAEYIISEPAVDEKVSDRLFQELGDDFKQDKRWSRELKKTAVVLSGMDSPDAEKAKVVMLSGSERKAGTTTVARNLSKILTAINPKARILLMDFNPSKGGGADSLSLSLEDGSPSSFLERIPEGDVLLVNAGFDTDTCKEVGLSLEIQEFIELAQDYFDTIIFDTPAFNRYPICDPLARCADCVVLVVPCLKARLPALNALQSDMEQLGINLLGMVLNYRRYPLPAWLLRFL